MPRSARTVFADIPHHITQRGNRRKDVFFVDEDYETYLEWLSHYCQKYELEILAYCLMTNHVHLVAVPGNEDSLHLALKPLHMRYAQRINRARNWCGHFWQGRFFSAPLDERYMWAAIRYVELNPVRACMVTQAEHYRWSSAPGHCGLRHDCVLNTGTSRKNINGAIDNWSAWLAGGNNPDEFSRVRQHTHKGLPCGSERFVARLENMAGRSLQLRPQGRPRLED
jgi:putative transposase